MYLFTGSSAEQLDAIRQRPDDLVRGARVRWRQRKKTAKHQAKIALIDAFVTLTSTN